MLKEVSTYQILHDEVVDPKNLLQNTQNIWIHQLDMMSNLGTDLNKRNLNNAQINQ